MISDKQLVNILIAHQLDLAIWDLDKKSAV